MARELIRIFADYLNRVHRFWAMELEIFVTVYAVKEAVAVQELSRLMTRSGSLFRPMGQEPGIPINKQSAVAK